MNINSYDQLNMEPYDYVEPSTPHPMTSRPAERRQMHSMYVNPDIAKSMKSPKTKNDSRKIHLILAVISLLLSVVTVILVVASISAGSNNHSKGEVNANGIGGVPIGPEFQVGIISDGCCSYEQSIRLESLFFLNESPICLTWGATSNFYRRGFNFAVLDLPRGGPPRLESCRTFDTWVDQGEDAKMIKYMEEIPQGRLVLISTMDESTLHFSNSSRALMSRFIKVSDNIDDIAERDSYALVGYTNRPCNCFPRWVKDLRSPYSSFSDDAKIVRLEVKVTSSWTC